MDPFLDFLVTNPDQAYASYLGMKKCVGEPFSKDPTSHP